MLSSLKGTYAPVTEKFLAACVKESLKDLSSSSEYSMEDVANDVVMDGLADLGGFKLLHMANEIGMTLKELASFYRDVDGDYASAFMVGCSEFCIPEVIRMLEQATSAEEEASFHEQVLTGSARRRGVRRSLQARRSLRGNRR